MKKLIIIGASGFGREVVWLVDRINKVKRTWDIIGFIDDDPKLLGTKVAQYPVIGGHSIIVDYLDAFFVCAIGSSSARRKIVQSMEEISNGRVQYANIIDPFVTGLNENAIGKGNIICAGAILTVDYEIGNHVIINLSCTIGHDAILRDYVTLYPTVNVSGKVTISESVEVGTGSQIIQGKSIGESSIIGAGSVVIRDIPSNSTAVGAPARVIKHNHT